MITLTMNEHKNLVCKKLSVTYQGEQGAELIAVSIPRRVSGHDAADCMVTLNFANEAGGDVICLDDLFVTCEDRYFALVKLSAAHTALVGLLNVWIELNTEGLCAKSNPVVFRVKEHIAIEDKLPEAQVSAFQQWKIDTDRLLRDLETRLDQTANAEACALAAIAAQSSVLDAEERIRRDIETFFEVKSGFANALVGHESGQMLLLGDISPIPHELEVTVEKANLLDLNTLQNAVFFDNGDGSFTMQKSTSGRFSNYADIFIPAQTAFTVSASELSGTATVLQIQCFAADGTTKTIGLSPNELSYTSVLNFETSRVRMYLENTDATDAYLVIRGLKLELDTVDPTLTVNGETYTPNEDGSVSGIISTDSEMEFSVDYGRSVTVVYNRDINTLTAAESASSFALMRNSADLIPDYVYAEAERIAAQVLPHVGPNTRTFLAIADLQIDENDVQSEQSALHAGMAMKLLRGMVPIDFAVSLGGHGGSEKAVLTASRALADGFGGIPNFRSVSGSDAEFGYLVHGFNPEKTASFCHDLGDLCIVSGNDVQAPDRPRLVLSHERVETDAFHVCGGGEFKLEGKTLSLPRAGFDESKTADSAQDTAFCVVTVDLETDTLFAACYGG